MLRLVTYSVTLASAASLSAGAYHSTVKPQLDLAKQRIEAVVQILHQESGK